MFAPFVVKLVGGLRGSLVGVLRGSDCFAASRRPVAPVLNLCREAAPLLGSEAAAR